MRPKAAGSGEQISVANLMRPKAAGSGERISVGVRLGIIGNRGIAEISCPL